MSDAMNNTDAWLVHGEENMVALGRELGVALRKYTEASVIFLTGDLGAGKTTLSRGILGAFGHRGAVKSPTYTLVEEYRFPARQVFHFDLYRLGDPEELEYMGIRDYFVHDNVCLLEWPARGEGYLPPADLIIATGVQGSGRLVHVQAQGAHGRQLLNHLQQNIPR